MILFLPNVKRDVFSSCHGTVHEMHGMIPGAPPPETVLEAEIMSVYPSQPSDRYQS